jgi:hypothetical protein
MLEAVADYFLIKVYTKDTKGIWPVMAAILLFKYHSLGLQAQSDAAREAFPTRVTRGFISNTQERKYGSFSGLF